MTKLRAGFYKIALDKCRRLDIGWFVRQAVKLGRLRSSFARQDGRTSTGPMIVHFFITSRCNLRCQMCDIPQRGSGQDMPTDDCKRIIDQISDLGADALSFTGGEPLLRRDIFELLGYARSKGLYTILVTNGLLLSDHIDRLIKEGPGIVNVSLDGPTAEVHDNVRAMKGAFEKTTNAIRLLTEGIKKARSNTEVVISTVLSRNNIREIDGLLEYCRGLGAARVIICPVHAFDKVKDGCMVERIECDYDISKHLIGHRLRRLIDNSDYYLSNLTSVISSIPPPEGCPAGYTTLFLDWKSNVYPCKAYLEIDRPVCNLKDSAKTLKQIWYSPEFDEFRARGKRCRLCFLTVNREFDTLFK